MFLFSFSTVFAFEGSDSTYYFHDHGFGVTLDTKWHLIPDSVILNHPDIFTSENNIVNKSNIIAVYNLKSYGNKLNLPFIVMDNNRSGRIPESELAKINTLHLTIDTEKSNLMKKYPYLDPLLNNIKTGQFIYDPRNETIWFTVKKNKICKRLYGSHLTNTGYISIDCYTPLEKEDLYMAEFKKIIASVRLDEKIKYTHLQTTKQNKQWLGLTVVAFLFFITGYIFYRNYYSKNSDE